MGWVGGGRAGWLTPADAASRRLAHTFDCTIICEPPSSAADSVKVMGRTNLCCHGFSPASSRRVHTMLMRMQTRAVLSERPTHVYQPTEPRQAHSSCACVWHFSPAAPKTTERTVPQTANATPRSMRGGTCSWQ